MGERGARVCAAFFKEEAKEPAWLATLVAALCCVRSDLSESVGPNRSRGPEWAGDRRLWRFRLEASLSTSRLAL